MQPVLLIHGGAGSQAPGKETFPRVHALLLGILDAGYRALSAGKSATHCVALSVEMLEDEPYFNAGRGSKIQSDGVIRMSASMMDGHRGRFAGCVNAERVKNPVRLAQFLLKAEDRVLMGANADRYAREQGLPWASPYTEERRRELARRKKGKSGTVGAVALDSRGRLAVATSTGGKGFEYPGRVSDTPTIAANYANAHCAVSATGIGEQIVEFAVAARICTEVAHGITLSRAATRILRQAKREDAHFGWIALDRRGNASALASTPHLCWGMARGDKRRIRP